MTTAFKAEDIKKLKTAFVTSIDELIAANILKSEHVPAVTSHHDNLAASLNTPPAPGARLGMDESGNPAWYVQDEKQKGTLRKIEL